MKGVLTNENIFTVSRVGSALEADKKINLALKISVNVHAAEASRTTAQGRPADVRGDGLHTAGRMPLARSSSHIWTVEFRLHSLAALVSVRTVGEVTADVGAESSRPTAVCRHQPHQGASGCKQSRWWPTKSGDWAYQGRPEYQAQCLGGQPRAARQFELGPGTSGRCKHSARRGAPAVAENDDCCRQGLRQRRVPGAIAAMGKPGLYSTPLQPAPARQLAPRPLPQAAQGRELIPTIETQPEGWDTL
jgi:hypothetical protein